MLGAPRAGRRIVASALIASTILLRPSASGALDNVTLITDFGYNGRHAYFFEARDRGYYRDAGLEMKSCAAKARPMRSARSAPVMRSSASPTPAS
jgi:ABC-type nitrate/sulfonate/bicarbonate transport system substrate-binding protein